MKSRSSNNLFLILVFLMISGIFSSCEERTADKMLVFTETSVNPDHDYITGNSWRFLPDSRIVAVDYQNPAAESKILTSDFYSACAPDISCDGKFMLFAGQKKKDDLWQIFEMNLADLKVRQITNAEENCIDPVYLPGKRFVFSKFTKSKPVKESFALFTGNLDGSETGQITFNPHTYFASTVLSDGRILSVSRRNFPEQDQAKFMVFRPDGTKQRLFYQGEKNTKIISKGRELVNGKVFFIERDNKKGNIISVNYNRPLHSRVNLSSDIEGDFYSVLPVNDSTLIVSYRPTPDLSYAFYKFDVKNKKLGKMIFQKEGTNIIDAVLTAERQRPRNLPSELNMSKDSGIMVCQDINFTDQIPDAVSDPKAVKIELLGTDTSLGVVNVEKDGSFYLKMKADIPFRIQTLDKDNNVVNGPGTWLYIRPNERLGCVGCHEDQEQAPLNRQPLAVRKDPVVIQPLSVKDHKEKSH